MIVGSLLDFGKAEVGQIPLGGLDDRHLAYAKPVYLSYGLQTNKNTLGLCLGCFVCVGAYLSYRCRSPWLQDGTDR